jgi:hypothetical protein
MVRALSAAQRAANLARAKEEAYTDAVSIYLESRRTYETSKRKAPISLRDLVTRYRGLINLTTLSRRVKGLPSASDAGRLRTKLKPEEESMLVKHLQDQAALGFPYTHRGIVEVANDILRARHERQRTQFRPLGKRWSSRFMLRHSHEIKAYWSTSLHSNRAKCVNSVVLEAWYDLRERAQRGDFTDGTPIHPENIANMDETGWVPAVRQTHRVIGPTGQKLQYEIQSGMRENVTIIGTILADGTSTRPIVIFKGTNIQSRWGIGDPNHNIAKAQ